MSSYGWDNFWKDQRQSFLAAMKIATGFFTAQIQKRYHLNTNHAILDYNYNPGFITNTLTVQDISFTSVDINEFYIEKCRENHPESTFIHITTDIAVNKKILDELLMNEKFDYIIILSVTQYLKSTTELQTLINMLHTYISEKNRIILTDIIDENTSSVKDTLSILFHYIKIGKIPTFVRFMLYLMFSNYKKVSGKIPLLMIPEQSIREIAANNSLQYEKVPGLTIQKTRYSYVLSNLPNDTMYNTTKIQ